MVLYLFISFLFMVFFLVREFGGYDVVVRVVVEEGGVVRFRVFSVGEGM